ncbi:MAG TPA: TraR/DksA C4-type zinc finger protein [Steroidobacteraceae bacterium]|jgi:RNA polymerase-binding transcription factor DksA|nr:TraR/DksA C4-type zinc finger protein [Steroidobacteraceae bacterium]
MLSTYWSPAELQGVQRALTAQQRALLQQIDEIDANLERLGGELIEVALALNRLRRGVFGVCTRCGQDIAASRLRAHPVAARCVSCQRSYEPMPTDGSL